MENGTVDEAAPAPATESLNISLGRSGTRDRIRILGGLQQSLKLVDLDGASCEETLKILFNTYPRYHDRHSRRAVRACLKALLRNDKFASRSLSVISDFILLESQKKVVAPTNAFVLLEWSILVQTEVSQHHAAPDSDFAFARAVVAAARSLEKCRQPRTRTQLRRSALVLARRGLHAVFEREVNDEDILNTTISCLVKGPYASAENLPYVAVVTGVCMEIPALMPTVRGHIRDILSFYTTSVIGSKHAVPEHIASCLHELFAFCDGIADFEVIFAALEKAILRSPEAVLNGLIPFLATSLPSTLDLSDVVLSKLLQPLHSSLRSSNATVREGVVLAFTALAERCRDPDALSEMCQSILAPMRSLKASTPEMRSLLSRLLLAMPRIPKISQSIASGIASVAAKEANENALEYEATALCKHFGALYCAGARIEQSVFDMVYKGCRDKRPAVNKAWHLRLGEVFWELGPQLPREASSLDFLRTLSAEMMQTFDEVCSNPVASLQSGLVPTALLLLALVASGKWNMEIHPSVKKEKVVRSSLVTSPRPSFVLNSRVITRLTLPDEMIWAIRALASLGPDLASVNQTTREAWAEGLIYFLVAADVPSSIRRATRDAITSQYLQSPGPVAESIVVGLWDWLHALHVNRKDSLAVLSKTGTDKLYTALRCVNVPKSARQAFRQDFLEESVKNQLVMSLVLDRDELLPGNGWITTCLRMGVDPGALVQERYQELMSQVVVCCEKGTSIGNAHLLAASCKAAADLAFVRPATMIPILLDEVAESLDPGQFDGLGQLEAAIAQSPEGVTFVDVLAKDSQHIPLSKNPKEHNIMKWEEDLRSQLAQKRGQTKKLTTDQQAKVDAQLAHEVEVRKTINAVQNRLRRGAGLVQALANGPPIDATSWMTKCVSTLLNSLKAGAALFVGDELAQAYLACSKKVSPRLASLGKFVGVATLRGSADTRLPPDYEVEPLSDLIARVLYRLRLAAEQRPFDSVTLSYALPLVFAVLQQGSIGSPTDESDEAGTQVLLALEFLSFHMGLCSETSLPRDLILSHLILAMQRYNQHYRLIKDSLMNFGRSMSGNMNQTELDVLLAGVTSTEAPIRSALLQMIHAELDLTVLETSKELWLVCHDMEEDIAELASAIWEENGLSEEESLVYDVMQYLGSPDDHLRSSAAKALAGEIRVKPDLFSSALQRLKESYVQAAQPIIPQRDKFGMVIKGDTRDPWELRSGISKAFREMCSMFTKESLVPFMHFLISQGPLADRNHRVRSGMLEAGTTVVSDRGKESLEPLMDLYKSTLELPEEGTDESDWVREAVIILYGSLARHLPRGDGRVEIVIAQVLESLHTPSESVQFAVSGCLPPLVRLVDREVSSYVEQLLKQLFEGKQYASRRGAGYGIAGLAKGRGLSFLRQYRIMSALHSASQNKKIVEHRQGALLGYEMLSLILGRVFEPYIIEVLPQLLSSFGDSNPTVREACLDTAKTCFSRLSSFGVKQVLPRLLEGLDDSQWRSKKGACDLLGAMAYLDPQQLAVSLPDIIPPLAGVLNDSHKEVRLSANRSLQRFGEVISNPEVKSLVDILLKALSDPTKYTEDALNALIRVSFVHYLDAPSLALVVRILERGLGDRSSTKRKSAQIIGSLAHLTERKDLVSHLPILVSGLRSAAVDPVPATRATASKALGSLVEKLGEDALPDLIPSLMSSLKIDTGAGDRLGSAQALSEVLAGLGSARLEETMPSILRDVASTKATVREGFMTLFIFLPACFGNNFASYLSQIIPSILGGLADELEAIRDIALRAGRLLVKNFSIKAIDLLLPELQRGLANGNYRIRLSSVELVGDLLFNLTGIANRSDMEEDGEGAAQAGQSLLEVLGEERRNKVLSSLYICRCDTSGIVRSAAIAVWKALVATPRTLKEVVPTLTQMIIGRLASSNLETRVIAGNALGEMIRKAGEGVLASLLPSLEEGLHTSTDADRRQGICTALREIILAASPDALHEYEKQLISILRTSVVDSDAEVREAAAESFDNYQRVFGKRAVDEILPYLLSLLQDPDQAGNALSALLTLLTDTSRANMILPNLIPTLLSPPITNFNARALASLASIEGPAMNRRLPSIINGLADGLTVQKSDSELGKELNLALKAVLCSVDEFDGLNTAMSVMLAMIKHDDHQRRAVAASHLAGFFSSSSVDFSRYSPDLIRVLLISFDDRDGDVVKAAWDALSQMVARLRKEEMESLVAPARQTLQQVGVAGALLPGFSLPRGIFPILQIFLQGLMNGSADQRTQSALAISDIIDRSSQDSLKPFVTQITGPLIRVVSERSVEVKSAILHTLNQLLEKIPAFLKPFLPQLQRTFTKSLADPGSETLRVRATRALGTLITLTPRVDPLIAELVAGSRTADVGVRGAMLRALQEVVSKVGSNMSDNSKDSILGLIDSLQEGRDDRLLITNSRLLGGLIRVLPSDRASSLIKSRVLCHPISDTSILAVNAVLIDRPHLLLHDFRSETGTAITTGLAHRTVSVQHDSVLAAGKFFLAEQGTVLRQQQEGRVGSPGPPISVQPMIDSLVNILLPQESQLPAATSAPATADIDSRRLSLVVIRTACRHYAEQTHLFLSQLAPAVFSAVRDPVIPVKLAAEAAFLELFSVVDREAEVFERYMTGPGSDLGPQQKRSMQEYFKRVAVRLAAQARERREADGGGDAVDGALGLAADEKEDEAELWSLGGRMRDDRLA